jgi:hypothetical protein
MAEMVGGGGGGRHRRSWGDEGDGRSSRDLWLLLLGRLWEDNSAGDQGRLQRPIGRVVVGWAEGCLD